MQVDSIIANTITDEIRLNGHQSIRLSADGFSILVSDASFVPVWLKRFSFSSPTSLNKRARECRRILEEQNLFSFQGEVVFINDTPAAALVPDPFFDESRKEELLGSSFQIAEGEAVLSRRLKNRSEHILCSFPGHFQKLTELYSHEVKVLHAGECMVSLSDQVSASDHQRGFVLIEVQKQEMEILVIKGDNIVLSNRYVLKEPDEYLYHTLNTFKQLGLDRESVPLYYAGVYEEDKGPKQLMKKFIRKIEPVPYFLEGLDNGQRLQFLLLSEATKCA